MSRVSDSSLGIEVSRHYNDKEMREERREKREERREKREERRKKRERACARERTKARLCILFSFSIVAQRPCVRTSPSGGRQDKKQDLLSCIFPIFFLEPFSSIPLSDCHFDLCLRLWMARHTMRQGRCTRGLCP